VNRVGRRPLGVVLVAATAALIVALFLSGVPHEAALYAYVLLLVAVAVAALEARIASAFPATPTFRPPVARRREPDAGVPQLDQLMLRLGGGTPNAFDLHNRVRPLVQEIAAARLARHHGLELASQPERAHTLVGARTWELVRPGREPPTDVWNARGWSEVELNELVDELEAI
jgi:hypothetical protein